jgi:hypothetical protein
MGYDENDHRKIPKSQLRVFDPTSDYSTRVDCNFKFPFRQMYCDVLTDSILNPNINATTDPMKWESCGTYPEVDKNIVSLPVSNMQYMRNIKQ